MSHIGIADLAKAREQLVIGRGLESIGKTRFGTVVHSSVSVQRCIPAIQKAISFGRVKFDVSTNFALYCSIGLA